jgi:hypothetical protein
VKSFKGMLDVQTDVCYSLMTALEVQGTVAARALIEHCNSNFAL